MKACTTGSSTGFPNGAVPPPADPQAGGSVQFFIVDSDVIGTTLPGSGGVDHGAEVPISLFTGAATAGLVAGPDNALFTYLGSGQLRYTGPSSLFLLQGAVTVETSGVAILDIVINGVRQGLGTGTFVGPSQNPVALVAGAVRLLKTGDIVELGMHTIALDSEVALFQLEFTAVAVGRP